MGFDASPFQRVVKQNTVANVIQTCLTHDGGLLLLGEDPAAAKDYYRGELAWTPITLDSWYTVNATELSVEGHKMNVSFRDLNGPFPSDPCIVDSGTNFLSLTPAAFKAVRNYLLDQICPKTKLPGICGVAPGKGLFDGVAWTLSEAQVKTFPDIEIRLVGDAGKRDVALPLSAVDYLVPVDGKYRMGITEGDCIIGNTHMLRYWTVYDIQNNRIGFAEANHDKCAAGRGARLP